MEKVEMFKAKDGTIFSTEKECFNYELLKDIEVNINEFLDSDSCPYQDKRTAAIARKAIETWESYKR